MNTHMLAASALAFAMGTLGAGTFGTSAALAQGMPQSLLAQPLGAPWAEKKLVEGHAARERGPQAEDASQSQRTALGSSAQPARD